MLIHFDKILISDNKLELDIKVGSEPYYKDVIIKKVIIQDKSTYGTSTYVYTIETRSKQFNKDILLSDILTNINNNILFITVEISGAPTADCPCNSDVIPTAVYVDTNSILNTIKGYNNELTKDCSIPKGYINYLLLYKALEYSIKTCNYKEAIKYYNLLLKDYKVPVTSNCGCHG